MKLFLIMNPGSRNGAGRKNFGKIFDLLDSSKIEYDYKITDNLGQAYHLSAENNKAGYETIVAVGGDGTINQVLNGFYDDKGDRVSSTKMGVIYTGTSPDFCKSYRIPIRIGDAVNTIMKNKSMKVQVGKIILAKYFQAGFGQKPIDTCPDFKTWYFGCCVNIGLGASVARYANKGIRRILGDKAGTFLCLIKAIVSYRPDDFIVSWDGCKETVKNMYNLSIGRTFYIASGIKVKHNLKDEDKRFYNLLVKDMKIWHLLKVLKTIYSGSEIVNDNIISLRYSKVTEVYGNSRNSQIELDGDPAGFLPCKIEAAGDMLDLIVKENKTR